MSDNGSVIKPYLHHWGIRTLKVDEMMAWYSKVCGYEVVLDVARQTDMSEEMQPRAVLLTNDIAHHRAGFFSLPVLRDDPERRFMPAVNHLAFGYDSVDDLLSSWERLKGEGIEPVLCTDHGPSIALYYKDPDTNTVELCCDAWEEPGGALEAARGPAFAQNPFGRQFDPAKMLAACRSGVALRELHQRALADEYAPEQPGDPTVLM